jgi:N-acetylneuraminic acid mutarotase
MFYPRIIPILMTSVFRHGDGGGPAPAPDPQWFTDTNNPTVVSDFVANNNGTALVTDGTYIYAVLGRRTGEDFMNDIYRLPLADASGGWEDLATPFSSVVAHGAAVHHNGIIYYLGGYNNGFASRRTAILSYNIATGTWATTTDVLPAQWAAMSYVKAGDQLYMLGGDVGGASNRWCRFDPTQTEGSRITNLTTYSFGVRSPALAWDGGNFIYAIGGHTAGGTVDDVYRWNISLGTWVQMANMPGGRTECAALYKDGKIYVVHGRTTSADFTNITDKVWVYDVSQDSWSELAEEFDAPQPRTSESGRIQIGNLIYILGGINSTPTMSPLMDAFGFAPEE